MNLPGRLPSPGTWHIDPFHTNAQFVAVHRGAGRVRGRFTRVRGTFDMATSLVHSTATVSIDAKSVHTGLAVRDRHLISAELLDVETYPDVVFEGAGLILDADGRGTLSGQLTVHGVTRTVILTVAWLGSAPDPFADGEEHIAFSAVASLSLADFGIIAPTVPMLAIRLIEDRVALELDVVLIRYDPAALLAEMPLG